MAGGAPVKERAGGSSTARVGIRRETWPRSETKLNLCFLAPPRQKRDENSAGRAVAVARSPFSYHLRTECCLASLVCSSFVPIARTDDVPIALALHRRQIRLRWEWRERIECTFAHGIGGSRNGVMTMAEGDYRRSGEPHSFGAKWTDCSPPSPRQASAAEALQYGMEGMMEGRKGGWKTPEQREGDGA